MNENDTEKKEFEKALFKYGIIAPLLEKIKAKSTEYGEKKLLIEQSLKSFQSIPHSRKTSFSRATLYNWIACFLRGGFNALKRKRRADCGKSRSVSQETIQKAIELKKENPLRSTSCNYPAAETVQFK